MKLVTFTSVVFVFLIFACADNRKTEERLKTLEEKDSLLGKENKILKEELKSLNDSITTPFLTFQRIVKAEYNTSPYLIMQKYEDFIGSYHDTYWAHEAKKRLKNIKSRLKYYDSYKGWMLPKDINDEVIKEDKYIICPGC